MSFLEIWDVLTPIHGEIIGLFFTIAAGLLFWLFRAKVRLVFGRANNSINHLSVPDPNDADKSNLVEIYSEKFFLLNVGRKPATGVEFVLSKFPNDVRVWEPRDSELKAIKNNECLIKIPSIAPKELVIIDCVYIDKLAAQITSVKCSEVMGKEVPFQTVRKYSTSIQVSFFVVVVMGFAFAIQILLKLAGFVT